MYTDRQTSSLKVQNTKRKEKPRKEGRNRNRKDKYKVSNFNVQRGKEGWRGRENNAGGEGRGMY